MNFAVIGRVRYDDEDTCMLIGDAPNKEAAAKAFEAEIRENRQLDENNEEQEIYITRILSSATLIMIEA